MSYSYVIVGNLNNSIKMTLKNDSAMDDFLFASDFLLLVGQASFKSPVYISELPYPTWEKRTGF